VYFPDQRNPGLGRLGQREAEKKRLSPFLAKAEKKDYSFSAMVPNQAVKLIPICISMKGHIRSNHREWTFQTKQGVELIGGPEPPLKETVPLARRSSRFPCSGGTEYLQSNEIIRH
jgi:hypothetical protein